MYLCRQTEWRHLGFLCRWQDLLLVPQAAGDDHGHVHGVLLEVVLWGHTVWASWYLYAFMAWYGPNVSVGLKLSLWSNIWSLFFQLLAALFDSVPSAIAFHVTTTSNPLDVGITITGTSRLCLILRIQIQSNSTQFNKTLFIPEGQLKPIKAIVILG